MFYINAFQHVTPSLGEGCPNAVTKLRKKRHLQTCRALIGHHSIERPVSLSTPHVVRNNVSCPAVVILAAVVLRQRVRELQQCIHLVAVNIHLLLLQ